MLRVALNAQGLSGIAQAILTNLLTAFAKLALVSMTFARRVQLFESIDVVTVALTSVSPTAHWDRREVVFAIQVAQLSSSFSSRGTLLRCMDIK